MYGPRACGIRVAKRKQSALSATGMKPKNANSLRGQIRNRGIGMMKPVRVPARLKPRLVQMENVKKKRAVVPLVVVARGVLGKLWPITFVAKK